MKKAISALLLLALLPTVTGCWDSRELDTLFIVTGLGLDTAQKADEVAVDMQIVKVSGNETGSGSQKSGGSGDGKGEILLEASGKSVLSAISTLRHESTRTLFLQHNQVIVFGRELAQRGIQENLDFFLRDEEARMETLVLVAEGEAKEVLDAQLDQDKNSGIALTRIIREFSKTSVHLKVDMLSLVSKLLQKTTALTIPIVEVIKQGDQTKVRVSKIAVFKGDRMVGEMAWDEVTGYLWIMGEINDGTLELVTEKGTAVLNILQAHNTIAPVLADDGRMGVILHVDTKLDVEELNGFGDITLKELYAYLIQEATKAIEGRIFTTYEKTRQLNTDIYGFGGMFHIKYPKQWKALEQQWDVLFPGLQLVLSVNVHLTGTGKTAFSLDMEENQK